MGKLNSERVENLTDAESYEDGNGLRLIVWKSHRVHGAGFGGKVRSKPRSFINLTARA